MPRYDMWVDVEGVNDLVLNEKGDWRFTSTIQESLAQRLSIRLNTFLGEWGFNQEFGTPYRQRIWSGGLSKEELDSLFTTIILQEEDVNTVQNIISNYDRKNRVYNVTQIEVVCDDEDLVIPIHSVERRQNTYPQPKTFEGFEVCVFTDEEYNLINKIYQWTNFTLQEGGDNSWISNWNFIDEVTGQRIYDFVNEDLPETGTSTWWNQWKSI
ncbi:hypothetical protein [Vibrio phage S4-7]|nr:hypothetical protein [Vibrio phage S4-7]